MAAAVFVAVVQGLKRVEAGQHEWNPTHSQVGVAVRVSREDCVEVLVLGYRATSDPERFVEHRECEGVKIASAPVGCASLHRRLSALQLPWVSDDVSALVNATDWCVSVSKRTGDAGVSLSIQTAPRDAGTLCDGAIKFGRWLHTLTGLRPTLELGCHEFHPDWVDVLLDEYQAHGCFPLGTLRPGPVAAMHAEAARRWRHTHHQAEHCSRAELFDILYSGETCQEARAWATEHDDELCEFALPQ